MRGLIVAVVMFFAVSLQAIEVKTFSDMPNLRASYFFDLNNQATGVGAQSSVLQYKALDMNFGYVGINNKTFGTVSLSVNLEKLKIGNVTYAWSNLIRTDLGIWLSYNMEERATTYGLCASLIKIEK
jgi:hypothetical protein